MTASPRKVSGARVTLAHGTMHTVLGGHRTVDMLVGEQLPRIC
jgi:hypothetical protein